jgi:hypothetical protein
MAIIFHCEHCGKKIEAPDSAAGKWGSCPGCHTRIYVPSPEADEELKLAPIDESDIAKQKRLMAEANRLAAELLREQREPGEISDATASVLGTTDKDLTEKIITYLLQMANGELNEARQTATLIIPYSRQAVKILDKMALSEIPEPELSGIPQQVLSGLIKSLRTRMS